MQRREFAKVLLNGVVGYIVPTACLTPGPARAQFASFWSDRIGEPFDGPPTFETLPVYTPTQAANANKQRVMTARVRVEPLPKEMAYDMRMKFYFDLVRQHQRDLAEEVNRAIKLSMAGCIGRTYPTLIMQEDHVWAFCDLLLEGPAVC